MFKDDMQKMMAETYEPEIYRETVVFILGRVIIALFIVLTIIFLAMFIYQIAASPIGSRPAPDRYYIVMCLFFAFMTFIICNFSKLVVKATSKSLTVSYGVFKRVISWEDVADCYPDESSSLAYGGGIHIAQVNGKWRLVYNVLGGQRVVIGLKKGKFKEFVFSTKNPDTVMDVIKKQIGALLYQQGTGQ